MTPLYDQDREPSWSLRDRERQGRILQRIANARALLYDWIGTEYAPAVAADLSDSFWHDAELDMHGHWGEHVE